MAFELARALDTVMVNGLPRQVLTYYDPTAYGRPTLQILHSAATTLEQMSILVNAPRLTHDYGITVKLPMAAANQRWNWLSADDVECVKQLAMTAQDPANVFLAGHSAGGYMGMHMVWTHGFLFRAAALCATTLANNYLRTPAVRVPPVMLFNGTLDQRVPYEGTDTTQSALATAQQLAAAQGLNIVHPVYTDIPNTSVDLTTTKIASWKDKVKLYTITGGGHTWPGSQYNPTGLGRTSMDFDATLHAWAFMRRFIK